MKQFNRALTFQAIGPQFDVKRLLTISLDEWDWPTRIDNVFKEHHIKTFSDLVQHTEFDLRRYHNIGKLSVNFIKECLASVNLCLGMARCPHCGEFIDLPLKHEKREHSI